LLAPISFGVSIQQGVYKTMYLLCKLFKEKKFFNKKTVCLEKRLIFSIKDRYFAAVTSQLLFFFKKLLLSIFYCVKKKKCLSFVGVGGIPFQNYDE